MGERVTGYGLASGRAIVEGLLMIISVFAFVMLIA